jgi:hypothetical protein
MHHVGSLASFRRKCWRNRSATSGSSSTTRMLARRADCCPKGKLTSRCHRCHCRPVSARQPNGEFSELADLAIDGDRGSQFLGDRGLGCRRIHAHGALGKPWSTIVDLDDTGPDRLSLGIRVGIGGADCRLDDELLLPVCWSPAAVDGVSAIMGWFGDKKRRNRDPTPRDGARVGWGTTICCIRTKTDRRSESCHG